MSKVELNKRIKEIKEVIKDNSSRIVLTGAAIVSLFAVGMLCNSQDELNVIGCGQYPSPKNKYAADYYQYVPEKYDDAALMYGIVDPHDYSIGLYDENDYTILYGDEKIAYKLVRSNGEEIYHLEPVECSRIVPVVDFISANPQFKQNIYTKTDIYKMWQYANDNDLFSLQVYALKGNE